MNHSPPPPPLGLPVVHIVDDEAAVRDALAWLLRTRRLLSHPHDSGEAFEAWLEGHRSALLGAPACLLLDMRMPGGMGGVQLFERLIERALTDVLPVIFLSGHGDVPTAVAAIQRGAFDFVEKPFSDNALVDRIERALERSRGALERGRLHMALQKQLAELTEREREVMQLVVDGRPNKLIADALAISVRTVEVHRARVFEKMGVRSAVELANLLREQTG
ncbi:MAG: response regulator transcription factor [Methylibium sp.]|uniref:response regulator transcription factor n=1 Tax=Methylibium sp. TaxID=2067992 RepID=UPI00184628F2|nr:response regulator [Methylibium sp.]MBA3596692.1 response regulator transcription factor [Methylibium sp.]